MHTITQPLSRIAQAMQEFVGRKHVQLLHVVTTEPLRLAVLEHIAAAEHYGANRCPFFVLEAPCEAQENGWTVRAEELRGDVKELRKLVERGEENIALPALRPVPADAPKTTPFTRFWMELRALVESVGAPIEGVVVVLAPLWVRSPKTWVEEVAALVFQAGLGNVRWVIVDLEEAVCAPFVNALGQRAQCVDARMNDTAARAETDEMLAAIARVPTGATGARLSGAAGPREVPPPRKHKVAPLTPALAQEAGLPAAFAAPDFAHRLRTLILSAAKSMRDGDALEAVRQQRDAQKLCFDTGLVRESMVMELVLGGYALQGGAYSHALDVFRHARQRAETAGFAELAVQAQLALSASLLAQGHTAESAVAYTEAGQLGVALDTPVLAIESYRMAGQLLATSGRVDIAAGAWRRALDIAAGATPLDRKASSAAEVARALAAVCRKHRLPQQAAALEAQAAAMEAPVYGESPPPLRNGTGQQPFHEVGGNT